MFDLIGLTGSISTGKSTITKILTELGCYVVDADLIARQALDVGTDPYNRVVELFGKVIVTPDGSIDRVKLGDIVFNDTEKRKLLESIIHPYVKQTMKWSVMKGFLRGYSYVILDVPLLIENQSTLNMCSKCVIVYCEPEAQLTRLMQRDECTEDQAKTRINSQISITEKKQYASDEYCLIDNTGSLENTRSQAIRLKQHLDDLYMPRLYKLLRRWFGTEARL